MPKEKEASAELTFEQAVAQVSCAIPAEMCDCGGCFACAWARVQEFTETMQQTALSCPECGSYLIDSVEGDRYDFDYGENVELFCYQPVRHCLVCEKQWTDMEAEYAQSIEVVKHLQQVNRTLTDGLQAIIDVVPGGYEAGMAREALHGASRCKRSD
jgi:hypothetical protein